MHFPYILPFVAFGLGVANAAAIDDSDMLDTRTPKCEAGINLIRLDLRHGKSFTGFGKPGDCKNLPKNVNDFDVNSRGTKSLVPCFECTVYEKSNCQPGDSITIGGNRAFKAMGKKKQHWRSWKCECKD
ncbi:hypothetical protein Forpe1208_v005415 [Fusarium oxysporum f. sp. rapae]|uniref:Uncharacterized protein n=1 Tax=Fusarium oxysporum f. sp. rapae TaxID=485398 RepID=A0A8J5P1L6_FUSOX|nr:hypothetical protein Forpe1208_v005415 [Fusarium oxysporum f. sp. rapae]